ncbi:hypothetical protein TNCV_2973771 [Trichonephila clavipes]|nr:hypothetical protein TNCV_2973771 [Trichonephila clavipes]
MYKITNKLKLEFNFVYESEKPSGRVLAYRASKPQVRFLFPGWERSTQPFSRSINEYQACLGTKTLEVSLQTDHLIGTSARAPQHPMVTYTEMGTVGPDPHGLLRH